LRPAWAKISETLFQKQVRNGGTLVVPSAQEAEVGGSQFKVSPGKSLRLHLKNKLKTKGLGMWLKWQRAYLSSNPNIGGDKEKNG
jgi:hypothetical protein